MPIRATGERNLILAGFMGTGKTTVGQLVAAKLGMPFVDTDPEVEKRAGRSVANIFATSGEAAFRKLEAEVCQQLATVRGQVIATGGGALLDPASRQALEANGLVICLTCDLDEITQRIGSGASRPLYADDRARLEELLAQRASLYDSLPYHVDTTHRRPEQVAEEIVELWKQTA